MQHIEYREVYIKVVIFLKTLLSLDPAFTRPCRNMQGETLHMHWLKNPAYFLCLTTSAIAGLKQLSLYSVPRLVLTGRDTVSTVASRRVSLGEDRVTDAFVLCLHLRQHDRTSVGR